MAKRRRKCFRVGIGADLVATLDISASYSTTTEPRRGRPHVDDAGLGFLHIATESLAAREGVRASGVSVES